MKPLRTIAKDLLFDLAGETILYLLAVGLVIGLYVSFRARPWTSGIAVISSTAILALVGRRAWAEGRRDVGYRVPRRYVWFLIFLGACLLTTVVVGLSHWFAVCDAFC
jgi:hypothetical protein